MTRTETWSGNRLPQQPNGEAARPSAGTKFAASTVRDRASGDLIVKIVNGEAAAQPVAIKLEGAKKFPATAQRTVFGGADADVTNTDGAPPAVVPVTETVPVSAAFTYEAPANSLTIFRLSNK